MHGGVVGRERSSVYTVFGETVSVEINVVSDRADKGRDGPKSLLYKPSGPSSRASMAYPT